MNEDKTPRLYIKIVFCTLFSSLLVFVCIYLFDVTDWPSKVGIVNSENSKLWLEYTVEYFGPIAAAFISFIGAIMAVSVSLGKEKEFRKEDSRKNVLPLIKVKEKVQKIPFSGSLPENVKGADDDFDFPIIELAKNNETTTIINLSIKNVGQREMYDVWIGGVKYLEKESKKYSRVTPILYKNEEYVNCVFTSIDCLRDSGSASISFKIYYKDCYDNWYYQVITGRGTYRLNSYVIDSFVVDSAPVLVNKNMLPKNVVTPNGQ